MQIRVTTIEDGTAVTGGPRATPRALGTTCPPPTCAGFQEHLGNATPCVALGVGCSVVCSRVSLSRALRLGAFRGPPQHTYVVLSGTGTVLAQPTSEVSVVGEPHGGRSRCTSQVAP